jgi:protein phosphatase
MPWSAKAQQLLREQYAAVGAAGRAALGETVRALDEAGVRDGVAQLAQTFRARLGAVARHTDA